LEADTFSDAEAVVVDDSVDAGFGAESQPNAMAGSIIPASQDLRILMKSSWWF
jgi:hypothetical protein